MHDSVIYFPTHLLMLLLCVGHWRRRECLKLFPISLSFLLTTVKCVSSRWVTEKTPENYPTLCMRALVESHAEKPVDSLAVMSFIFTLFDKLFQFYPIAWSSSRPRWWKIQISTRLIVCAALFPNLEIHTGEVEMKWRSVSSAQRVSYSLKKKASQAKAYTHVIFNSQPRFLSGLSRAACGWKLLFFSSFYLRINVFQFFLFTSPSRELAVFSVAGCYKLRFDGPRRLSCYLIASSSARWVKLKLLQRSRATRHLLLISIPLLYGDSFIVIRVSRLVKVQKWVHAGAATWHHSLVFSFNCCCCCTTRRKCRKNTQQKKFDGAKKHDKWSGW